MHYKIQIYVFVLKKLKDILRCFTTVIGSIQPERMDFLTEITVEY
jgi:hypothetical protein